MAVTVNNAKSHWTVPPPPLLDCIWRLLCRQKPLSENEDDGNPDASGGDGTCIPNMKGSGRGSVQGAARHSTGSTRVYRVLEGQGCGRPGAGKWAIGELV